MTCKQKSSCIYRTSVSLFIYCYSRSRGLIFYFLHFFRVRVKLTTHTHHTFSPCPLQNQTTPTILQALLHVKALRNVWLFLVPPSVTYIQQPLFLHANHRPPPTTVLCARPKQLRIIHFGVATNFATLVRLRVLLLLELDRVEPVLMPPVRCRGRSTKDTSSSSSGCRKLSTNVVVLEYLTLFFFLVAFFAPVLVSFFTLVFVLALVLFFFLDVERFFVLLGVF